MVDALAVPLRTPAGPMHEAQEPEGGGDADIRRPPDSDLPDVDEDVPDAPDSPAGVPPFTGEDTEDVGKRDRKKRDLPTM